MASQGRSSLKGGESAQVVPRKAEKKNHVKMTAVRRDGIMKELVEKEEKTKNDWNKKFGFIQTCTKEFEEKLVALQLVEAKQKNSTKAEFTTKPKIPITTSGMIGWGAERASNINIAGPLYVSPKSTITPDGAVDRKIILTQKHIVLG